MSYCTPADVCSLYPRFVRDQTGSVSDAQIQGWLDDASAVIHAAFMVRGLDVDNLANPYLADPSVTVTQRNQGTLLREWCRAYGVWKLGEAVQGSLSKNDLAISDTARLWWIMGYKTIVGGGFDKEFFPTARTVDITPGFGGIAGGEMPADAVVDPSVFGKMFAKWQIF